MKRAIIHALQVLLILAVVGAAGLTIHLPVFAAESWAVPSVTGVVNTISETVKGTVQREGSDILTMDVSEIFLMCQILGCSNDPNHPVGYNKSVVASLGKGIEYLVGNPPASTYAFAVDLGKTLGFLPRTYAQGVGFTGLQPLLGIWKAFRNIAYGLIAIIAIVIGFMVMLRKKIDPKTVVTVQNSIPRIVIALILVTFSYAIVGFMIDLMYVSMLLIANLLIKISPDTFRIRFLGDLTDTLNLPSIPLSKITPKDFVSGNFLTVSGMFFAEGWESLKGLFALFPWQATAGASAIAGLLSFAVSGFSLKSLAVGAIAPTALPALIVAVAVLFGLVRLFFLLLDAYIHIIIALITSPFHLMVEAIPGTNTFSSWMRNLIGKLLVFPIVVTLTLITYLLTSSTVSGDVWAPPLLWGTTSGEGLGGLIGLGMLLSAPSIVGGIQKALKGEPLVPAGVGAIVGPLGSGISQIMNLGYQYSMIKAYSRKDHAPSPYQQGVSAAGQNPGSILTGGGEHKS